MKNTDILSRITALLNKKVSLAQQTLENGTVIESDSFSIGDPIFAIDGENKLPLEIGVYTLEDGSILEVTEIGIIGDVKVKEEELKALVEVESELKEEELKEEEEAEDVSKNLDVKIKEIEAKLEELEAKLKELVTKIESIIGGQAEMKETLSSAISKKPLVHKPSEDKVNLSNVKVAPNTSGTEALIMALLSK